VGRAQPPAQVRGLTDELPPDNNSKRKVQNSKLRNLLQKLTAENAKTAENKDIIENSAHSAVSAVNFDF
jgi:hypothetical protein